MSRNSVTAPDGCQLEVAASVTAQQLHLSYAFSNGDAVRNAYLFNRLYEDLDEQKVFLTSPHRVYVLIEPGAVIVCKRLIPVPRNMAVEYLMIPCTSRVKPGSKLQESLELTLPLLFYTPYERSLKSPDASRPQTRQLSFELGYFLAHPEGDKLGKEVKTLQGPAPRFYPFPEKSQSLLRVELDLSVPVLVD